MPRQPLIIDPADIDFDRVIADIHEIRRFNRQRHEMEQLTAIVYEDPERSVCVGYKDLTDNEFWVRGHMPGAPLMPGVIMLECAAQLASYYTRRLDLMADATVGFGGLEEVRFRGVVMPGDRFIIVAQLLKVRSTMLSCRFQCFVRENLVCEGILKGIPLPAELFKNATQSP